MRIKNSFVNGFYKNLKEGNMFPDVAVILVFLGAGFIMLIVPGPAVLYITAQSIDQGTKAGIFSTLGIAVGSLIHVTLAALGISTILVTSAEAFSLVKYIGAGYLIYLGVRKILEKEKIEQLQKTIEIKYSGIFYKGILVNLFNPKTALFFFAFLPQFIDIHKSSPAFQMIFLGVLLTVLGIISDGIYALLAGKIAGLLKKNTGIMKSQKYITGSIYMILGAAAAFSGMRSK